MWIGSLGNFRDEVFIKCIDLENMKITLDYNGKVKKQKIYQDKEGYYFFKKLNLLFYSGRINFSMVDWSYRCLENRFRFVPKERKRRKNHVKF